MSIANMFNSAMKKEVVGGSFDEAVASAGLNFEVEKVPAMTAVERYVGFAGEGRVETEYQTAKDCFVIRRTDTLEALGHVGNRYAPVQNETALGPIRAMCAEGLATPVAGMTYDNGATGLLALRLDQDEIRKRAQSNGIMGTEIDPMAVVVLNHNGMLQNIVSPMPFRIYCINQLPGLGGVTIRHTGEAEEKMRLAADQMFSALAEGYGRFIQQVSRLREIIVSEPAFRRIVMDGIAPLKRLPEDPSARAVTLHEKQQARRLEIKTLWTRGAEHTGDKSAWEALNGAVQAMDHSELFDSSNRVKSLMLGTMSQKKRQVMNRLLKYGGSPRFKLEMDNPVEVARLN